MNQEEASQRLKESEIKSYLNETETLHQMVRQLDNQKTEARKRLDDLGAQVEKLRKELESRKVKVEEEEREMLVKKSQLDSLKNEEEVLQNRLVQSKKEVADIAENLGSTTIQISQVKAALVSLEEYEHAVTQGSKDLSAAIKAKDFHNLTRLLARPLTPPPQLQPVIIELMINQLSTINTIFF